MDIESLYARLPWMIQNLATSVEGYRIQHSRYGGNFQHLLEEAERRSFLPPDEASHYRDRRIREFIEHCYATVPYYSRLFRRLGVSPADIRTLGDLQVLPVLTKKDVQENYAELRSTAVPVREQIISHTSGTTGGGLRFATTLAAIQQQWAIWWRYRKWHGIEPGTWCGYFGGRSIVPLSQEGPPFWRYNLPGRQMLFSAYHMNARNLPSYVEALRNRQLRWLHGYPSLLALLAGFILEKGMDIGTQIRWITIGAENLMPQQAELIERAFGVRPRQHYGMAEAAANISECDRGMLHVDEDFSAVEFLPNADGESFKVVGTNFTNHATPLVRYDVQDCVTLSDKPCPCGRPGRVIEKIDGRQEDYIILRNGARLGRMDHIFKDLINIREAQIRQRTPGEIIIRIVKGKGFAECDETLLLKETRKRVGNDTHIYLEYVNKIERSSNGKLRFVVSEIAEGKIAS